MPGNTQKLCFMIRSPSAFILQGSGGYPAPLWPLKTQMISGSRVPCHSQSSGFFLRKEAVLSFLVTLSLWKIQRRCLSRLLPAYDRCSVKTRNYGPVFECSSESRWPHWLPLFWYIMLSICMFISKMNRKLKWCALSWCRWTREEKVDTCHNIPRHLREKAQGVLDLCSVSTSKSKIF